MANPETLLWCVNMCISFFICKKDNVIGTFGKLISKILEKSSGKKIMKWLSSFSTIKTLLKILKVLLIRNLTCAFSNST